MRMPEKLAPEAMKPPEMRPVKMKAILQALATAGYPVAHPGAANYATSGCLVMAPGGIGHNLSGRDIYPKQFEAEFNESGKVVIHVTVDKKRNYY